MRTFMNFLTDSCKRCKRILMLAKLRKPHQITRRLAPRLDRVV